MIEATTNSENLHQPNRTTSTTTRWLSMYILIPCICGAIGILPHLMGYRLTPAYNPFGYEDVSPIVRDETVTYAAVVRTALLGHWFSSAPLGPDRSETVWPSAQALGRLFPTAVMASLTKLLGIGMAFLIADFLFPALLAVVVIALSRELGLSFAAVMASAVAVLFGEFLIDLPFELVRQPADTWYHTVLAQEAIRPVENSRTWIPQISSILLFATAWSVWRCIRDERRGWIIASAILLATATYTYPYLWPVLFAAISITAICFFRDRAVFQRILFAILLGSLLSVPVIAAHLTVHHGPDTLRYGYGQSGLYLPNLKREILLALLIAIVYPRLRREQPLMMAFLVAPWLSLFAAMLVGLHLQDWHWISRNFLPWSMLAIVAAVDLRFTRFVRLKKWAFALSAVLLLLWASNRQYQASLSEAPLMQLPAETRQALSWLAEEAPEGAVVATWDTTARALIPVYTSSGVYLPFGPLSVMETEELLRRYGHLCALQSLSLSQSQNVNVDTYYWTVCLERGEEPLNENDEAIIARGWNEARDSLSERNRLPYRCDYLWLSDDQLPPVTYGWQVVLKEGSITLLKPPGSDNAVNGDSG